MSKLDQAARLFRDFSGHRHKRVFRVVEPNHDTHLLIGEAEGIAYNTVRDGKRERYVHEFRRESRPLLTASHDGNRLYLLDGAYRFTDRGIVDRTRSNMPAEIALVNPKSRNSHRTAAQKAATRKLLAWNRAHRGRKSNPSPARARRSGHRSAHRTAAQKAATAHLIEWSRSRRSNPIMPAGMTGEIMSTTAGALVGGLGVNLLVGYLPLPAALKTGIVRSILVIAGALGVGALAGKAMGRRVGEDVAAGGVAVVLYDLIKGFVVTQFPNAPLQPTAVVTIPSAAVTAPAAAGVAGGIGWTSPAMQMHDAGEYVDGMGAYVRAY